MRRAWLFPLFLLLTLWCRAAAAQDAPALILEDGTTHLPLRGHIERFEDETGGMGVNEVATGASFVLRPADAVERNYTRGAVWYRFTVTRRPGSPADWILSIGEPFIEDIRIYLPDGNGGFREIALGRRFANGALAVAARHHVAELLLPEGAPVPVLVRLASRDEIQFAADLWRPGALLFSEVHQAALLSVFFSALAFITFIYILFGAYLRDATMLAYAAYVGTSVMFGGSHSGVLAVVFPGLGGPLAGMVAGTGVLGNLAALIVMWDRVLGLRASHPRLHRAYMLGAALVLAGLTTVGGPYFQALIPLTFIATMTVTVVSMTLAAATLRAGKGGTLMGYYLAAFVPFLFFSLAHAAEALFPSHVDILFVRQTGTWAMMAHIAILSAALAHRVASMQRDRIKADADLAASRMAIRDHRNFVSMLSHQVRNPLAAILAALDVMEIKNRWSADAAKIRHAALRIRDLTADLLADNRLEEMSSSAMSVQSVDLVPLIEQACDERRDAARQGILFLTHCRAATVEGDPTLLGILAANLLDNAIKYSAADGEITVTLEGTGDTIALTVADQGPGIGAEDIGRVFDKYWRAATTASRPGTGLGLYLVRQIAERHGGTVSVNSIPGKGTAFTFRLAGLPA